MARSIPKVREGSLQQHIAEGTSTDTIRIGTAAWYSWLEQHHSFTFETPRTTFTARKEQRPGGWYWYAYRRRQGRLHSAYLGKSEELTLERLNTTAETLERAGEALEGGTQRPPRGFGDTALQVQQASIIPFPKIRSLAEQPTAPERAATSNLPAYLTPLIGREQAVQVACALLQRPEIRLVTLTGPGGVGKTRLGVQIATEVLDDFADGVSFVSLAPISDPDLVIPTIAKTFDLIVGDAPLENLKAFLRVQQLLLLLDNFEQVVTAAPLVVELLTSCPKVKVLLTSRMVLRVQGEYVFSVPPLALPDLTQLPGIETLPQYAAIALLLQRAQAIAPGFQLTNANARTLAEVCIRLDGLPLAIELAAARLNLLSPQALLARLEHRLSILTSGTRDGPARQQTLRSTLEWSYGLLTPEEQRLFRRLSAFVGDYALEAVGAICTTLGDVPANVLDGLASLLDKGLLQRIGQEGEEPRFMMLETIREYGLERLTVNAELEATRQAHADYYLALAEEAEPHLKGAEQGRWFARLEQEHDNLRAALQWSLEREKAEDRMEMALRLGGALRWFWMVRGYRSEGRSFLERALARSEGVAAEVRARGLLAAGNIALFQGDLNRAAPLLAESLALYRELENTGGVIRTLRLLGAVALSQGNLAAARSLLEEDVVRSKTAGNKEDLAYALCGLARVVSIQGEYAKACALSEESLALYRELGDTVGIDTLLSQLAEMLFDSQGDQATVGSLLAESLALAREVDDKSGIAICLSLSGQLALSQGDTDTARELVEESLLLFGKVGDRQNIAWSLSLLAPVATTQGDYTKGRALYKESLALAQEIGNKVLIASLLEGLARLAMAQGEAGKAAQLWGAAAALREAIGAPLPPVYRADYEHSVAAARTQLSERTFAAAWAEGRSMTPEQALDARGPVTMPQPPSTASAPAAPVKPAVTYPNELTAREVDVLRLLAKGLTSAQIAEQLILSLLTVNTHVRSIYSKLGVTSRSAATRWAIEHQLV